MRGEDIKQAREARGWTQTQLATIIGATFESVSRWEREVMTPRGATKFALLSVMPELGADKERSKPPRAKRAKSKKA